MTFITHNFYRYMKQKKVFYGIRCMKISPLNMREAMGAFNMYRFYRDTMKKYRHWGRAKTEMGEDSFRRELVKMINEGTRREHGK